MKFLPISMRYNPKTHSGSIEFLVADSEKPGELIAVGSVSIEAPISNEAKDKIALILLEERARILSEISG